MAYRSYFRSVLNDNFKILTWVLILFISITPNFIFIQSVNASAAEKWAYEPVMKDMNIHVKGYQVDQYGNAVNDYEYNTKIDPKTTANKQKMGTVGIGRLLKVTGWGMLGYEALAGLLEAVDWVIDPEAQSIWRHKKPKTDSSGVSEALCKGGTLKNYSGKHVEILHWTSTYTVGNCPLQAAESLLQYYSNNDGRNYQFIRWLPEKDVDVGYLHYTKTFIYNDPQYGNREAVVKVKTGAVVQPNPEKEYLTPDELADYANHTHPDYANPELAPKLEPKYSPKIASDLWKPSNSWEEINSPTVQEVERQLNQSSPTSQNKDIEQKTDEQGNPTGSFSLPDFCSWATPVCDFIKWAKEQPENDDNTQIEVENLDETLIFDDSQRFSFGDSCPSPEQFSVSFFGTTQNLEFSYQPLCDFMSMIKPFVVAGSYLIGAYIVMGLSRGSGE